MEHPQTAETSLLPESARLYTDRHYRRLLWFSVGAASFVSVVPLVVLTAWNYSQYQEAFLDQSVNDVGRLTTSAKTTMEDFLSERQSALSLMVQDKPLEELRDPAKLQRLHKHLDRAFGGFVDLGVIDGKGLQVAYAGPYELQGKNYSEQRWFHEVQVRGKFVSDVFMGHRKMPHFVIAVSHVAESGESFVLRATIDSDAIMRHLRPLSTAPGTDAFLINREGVLQTTSDFYPDKFLQPLPMAVPRVSIQAEVIEQSAGADHLIIGYAYLDRSPFILMLLRKPNSQHTSWLAVRSELALFMALSIALTLGVIFFGSAYMVNRTRQADLRRASILHNIEYTAKMAAIGRLAAGVAHEINNPLAIINEKAGLLHDLLTLSETLPPKEKLEGLIGSVLTSVDRCGAITHRLLGFAKHMDVQNEEIDLGILIKNVLGFLDKESTYRSIRVVFDIEANLPPILSDRGQLQQVFLNIINNAFAAVDAGGNIEIGIHRRENETVAVSITDDGMGIPEENLKRIFEPFFTTKKGAGTGLGLSITYGIVQKLGGDISVASKVGEGTNFTVVLPLRQG